MTVLDDFKVDKIALVTGAANGRGQVLAVGLAGAGVDVIRDGLRLMETKAEAAGIVEEGVPAPGCLDKLVILRSSVFCAARCRGCRTKTRDFRGLASRES